jgi:import receptor subunit TOM70
MIKGKVHAKEALSRRQPVIPSKHFVNTFMCSFAEDPVFNLLKREDQISQEGEEANQEKVLTFSDRLDFKHLYKYPIRSVSCLGDEQATGAAVGGFAQALELLRNKNYGADIISLCTLELDSAEV